MLAVQSSIVEGRVEKPTKQGDRGIVEAAEIYCQGWHQKVRARFAGMAKSTTL